MSTISVLDDAIDVDKAVASSFSGRISDLPV
jgi:hypothetical protein